MGDHSNNGRKLSLGFSQSSLNADLKVHTKLTNCSPERLRCRQRIWCGGRFIDFHEILVEVLKYGKWSWKSVLTKSPELLPSSSRPKVSPEFKTLYRKPLKYANTEDNQFVLIKWFYHLEHRYFGRVAPNPFNYNLLGRPSKYNLTISKLMGNFPGRQFHHLYAYVLDGVENHPN